MGIKQVILSKYAQVIFVLVSFSLMVISSYYYTSKIERKHLKSEAENAMSFTEVNIKNNMLEPESLLGGVSETIRSMLIDGDTRKQINSYLQFINQWLLGEKRLFGTTGFYGVFDTFGGEMLIGADTWNPPEDFNITERPWYTGAVKAGGEIYMTQPYMNLYSNEVTITLSRRIFDLDGVPFGIVCLNMELSRTMQYVIDTHFTPNGYGFLLSDSLIVIGHPDASIIGMQYENVRSEVAAFIKNIKIEDSLFEITAIDYRGNNSVVFIKKLENGWYMGIVTPKKNYFESIRILLIILILLGTVFAGLLIFMLLKLSGEKAKLDERMRAVSERHSRLLDTVNTAAAILLTNNSMETFKPSILKCFDLIGHCIDVDRIHIWHSEVIDGELNFIISYRWLSDYGNCCKPVPYNLQFPYSIRREWERLFLNGEYISGPVSGLKEEYKSFLGDLDVKSVVMIPIFLESEFWGFFGIDDCRLERTFSDEEISILTSAGLMMSNAINRNIQMGKIREAEQRTQLMLDAAPLSVIFWDNNLELLDCNQEAVKMFNLKNKIEFIFKWKMLSPEFQPDGMNSHEKGVALVKKALDEGYSRFEWMHQKLDGEQLPVEVTCIRVRYKNEFTVTEYVRDLREQKAMMAEMRKAEIAEESSKAKSDFLAKMSHEIRTPMNAILGIAEIQLQNEMHLPVTKEAFERIYDSGSLLLGIINDILDLSKIEAGKLVLNPGKYDIASLINDTVQLIKMRFESKPIEFILNVNEYLPLMLYGDELRIKQILNNILVNAFKYTDEGSVSMTVYAESAETEEDDVKTIVFVINDTGQGMTAEQVSKLGTEYARFNMEANRRTEGTGLGMNITRNLIHIMNGGISIESTPGMGSTFTVRLPQKYLGSDIIGHEMANNLMKLNVNNSSKIRNMQVQREYMPYGRVLVVDDVETNLYVARGLMAPYGVSLETAISGFEAVEKIRNGSTYDVIFMDHMMPKMDGIEATKIIRGLGFKNPIVALTANALTGQDQMFLENGFDEFISKPIDIRSLDAVLNKFIHDRYPPEIIEAAHKSKEKLAEPKTVSKSVDPQLAEFFVRDAKKALAIMELIYSNKCRRADDVSLLIINVHAMKSALANIGEAELSAEALKLEQAAREQNIILILSDIPSFFERLKSVIAKNEAKIVEHKTAEEFESGDNAFLREKLLVIKTACESFDKKTAKDALAETRKKTWPQPVDEQLANLAGYLLHSEFDEAVKFIDNYVKQLQ